MWNSMFDILMEIRKVDKQISEQKSKWQKSQQELILLERSISHVRDLQLKAASVMRNSERQNENANTTLKEIHDNYCKFTEYINAQEENTTDDEEEIVMSNIEKLKKIRDNLKDKIATAKSEKERVAQEVNEIDLQISIQKKKNAAMFLRLQKNLKKCLQEEKNLKDELMSNSNI